MYHTMKIYGEVEVQFHSFRTGWRKLVSFTTRALYLLGTPGEPQNRSGCYKDEEIFNPFRESNSYSSVV
jgi:hypothetical protein